MLEFSGHFNAANFIFPEDWNFERSQGKIILEIDDTREIEIMIPSLYHFFIVHIVAECQKSKPLAKDHVDPRELFHYLQQLNLKWGDFTGYKKIVSLETVQANWRRSISSNLEETLPIFKHENEKRYRTRDQIIVKRSMIFSRVYKRVTEKGKSRKKVFYRINVSDPFNIYYQDSLIGSLTKWKSPRTKEHGARGSVKKPSEFIWPLKLGEQVLDVINTEERYFRRSGPLSADIRTGIVSKPPEYDKLKEALDEHDAALLIGPKASGKSVLARMFAYDWMKSQPVAFLEINQSMTNTGKVIEKSQGFGRECQNALLIIEDAHLQPTLVNELLFDRQAINCKILITLRNPIPKLPNKVRNIFHDLTKIEIDPLNVETEIISSFFRLKHWKLTNAKRTDLLSISKGNLWILSYALKSLINIDGNKIDVDEELVLMAVKEELNDLACIDALYPRLLITLSVLYRFEIPTDLRFLYKRFSEYQNKVIEELIRNLCSMREIVEIRDGKHYLYGLPHSVLADLYFKFVVDPQWEENEIYGDELDFLINYIESPKAANWSSIIPHIDSIASNLGLTWPKILKKLSIKKIASKITMAEEIILTAEAIWSPMNNTYRQAGKDLWKYIDKKNVADKILDSKYVLDIEFCIRSAFEVNPEAGRKLWGYINKRKLADKIVNSDFIDEAGSFIHSIFQANTEMGTELWGHINKGVLGKKISRFANPKDVRLFLEQIYEVNPEFVKVLSKYINIETFAGKIANSDELYSAGSCINRISQANTEMGTELWGHINKEVLGKKFSRFVDIDNGYFLRFIFEINPEFVKDLYNHINIVILAEHINTWILTDKIVRSDGLDVIRLFIKYFSQADTEMGTELWKHINKDLLGNKILSFDDPSDILFFLEDIFKTNPEFVKDISKHIYMEILADKILDSDDIGQAALWIKYIYQADNGFGEKLWRYINKDLLSHKFSNTVDLIDFGGFLKSISEANPDFVEDFSKYIDKETLARNYKEAEKKPYLKRHIHDFYYEYFKSIID